MKNWALDQNCGLRIKGGLELQLNLNNLSTGFL